MLNEKWKTILETKSRKLLEALSPDFQTKYGRNIVIDVVIKRFECLYEALLKCLGRILENKGIKAVSPLACFTKVFKMGLIDKRHEAIFTLMVKKRHDIVHISSDEDAYTVYLLIKNTFVEAILGVFEKTKTKLSS